MLTWYQNIFDISFNKCTKHQFRPLYTCQRRHAMSDTSKTAKIIKRWYHSPSRRLTVNVNSKYVVILNPLSTDHVTRSMRGELLAFNKGKCNFEALYLCNGARYTHGHHWPAIGKCPCQVWWSHDQWHQVTPKGQNHDPKIFKVLCLHGREKQMVYNWPPT